MFKLLSYLAVVLAFCFASMDGMGEEEILLWAVNEDATIDNGPSTLYQFLELMPYDGENYDIVYGAKVALTDSSGNFIRYLENRMGDNSWTTDDIDIGHPSEGYVGIDAGTSGAGGIQSRMGDRELAMERCFQMYVGQCVWNYETDEYDFTPILYSENVQGSYLMEENNYTYTQSGVGTYLGPDDYTSWIPTEFYTVNPVVPVIPEPSTSLLCIIGFGVLMLRRKHGLG